MKRDSKDPFCAWMRRETEVKGILLTLHLKIALSFKQVEQIPPFCIF